MKKLIILQTASPDYRKKVFQTIKDDLGDYFDLFSGDEFFEASIKTDYSINFIKQVNNNFLLNRKLLFQTRMWQETMDCQVLVLEMNPRIISNWILLLLRNISNKKTILWGHAWPREGEKAKSDMVRNLMRELADEIVVYTKTQAIELQKKMPNKKITSASNAVFNKNEMQVSKVDEDVVNNIIYVGRLTELKKTLILTKAFIKIIDKLPNSANLLIIGDGKEKLKIKRLVLENKLQNRIKVLGHIGDYQKLKDLYSKCLFSVSPGYVGLSITQSFGFGVPMLISKNENHSPEIEVVDINTNAIFFKTDNISDLSLKILEFYENKPFWIKQRKEICNYCKENYSVENMAKKFINLL